MPSTVVDQSIDKVVPVVVGIIYHPKKSSLLVSKRTKDQHLAGLWEFPGGKIEPREAPFHALQRELKEELGIHVQSAHPFKQITHSYKEKTVELQFWKVTHFSGQEYSCENQEIQWVAIDDLLELDFPDVNKSIIGSLNLPKHWMITKDFDGVDENLYIQNFKRSIEAHSLKQVLFRSKNLSDDCYFKMAEQLKSLCAKKHCFLLLNRPVIDESIDGVGWHLTSDQLQQFNRNCYSSELFVSASCHHLDDLQQAEAQSLNCVLLSPVKQTKNYRMKDALGWLNFKRLANQTRMAVYALGGLTKSDLTVAQYHGAVGIAGISLFDTKA